MPRCQFGTPDKVNEDATTEMNKCSPILRQVLAALGLHDVSALNPSEAFVLVLTTYLNVTTEEEFLYLDPEWPEQAAASGTNHPTFAAVQAFIVGLAGQLTWRNAGAQLQDDQRQLASRIMRAYKEVFKVRGAVATRQGSSAVAWDDMDDNTAESISAAYLTLYGHPVAAGRLASSAICNRIHRQFSTGWVLDDLKTMIPRSESRAGKAKFEFDFEKGFSMSGSSLSKGIGSPAVFLERLQTYLYTVTYVAVMHVAPADQWNGRPHIGVMRGTRYQFTRPDADFYYGFWSGHADKFKSDVPELIRLESQMRATWIDKHGTETMSLASALRESVLEKAGSVEGWRPKREREWEAGPSGHGGRGDGGKGGGRQLPPHGGKGGERRDISKLPGFRQGLPPFKGRHEGKEFCQYYNRGQQCWMGDACNKHHKCNAIKPDGTPCFEDHSRQQHQL